MDRSELRRMIRDELAAALHVIMVASSENATGKVEDIVSLLQGMPTQEKRPTMRPYGFISRAPKGTTSVVARQGNQAGNRVVLGHRDDAPPTVDNEGDVMLYNASGQQIYLKQGNIKIGSGGAAAARAGDPVGSSAAFVTWLSAVGTATGAGVAPTSIGTITSGSAHVTVED